MYGNGCCLCLNLQALCDIFNRKADKENITEPQKNDKPPTDNDYESIEATQECYDEEEIYKAIWPFQARAEEELSFQEGEMFHICERSGAWWKVVKLNEDGTVKAEGYVPHNYLARSETVKEQPWYFGTLNRFETQNLLLAPGNGIGAFLVRHSEKDKIGCVLSVVVSDREVKHIRVHKNDEGNFYLDQSRMFPSVEKLVDHYSKHSVDHAFHLKEPCIKPEPEPQDLSHETVDDWELPKDEFTLEEQLGKGFFADVYRGNWKGIVNVAIKILKKNECMTQKEFRMETEILKKLRHRHLITLFAVCTSSAPFYIITELMEKGNLLNFLREQEGRDLEPQTLTEMASQVADGMAFLEEQNSIHRDLAARNVLVGQNYICKVADFGLARIIKEPIYTSEDKKIPYKWCAPETISHGRFSNKSDVWSFGILLYEMFSYGGIPYPGYTNCQVFNLIGSGYRMPAPDKCPSHIYDIMLMCWKISADERPDFSYVKDLLMNNCTGHLKWTCNDMSDPAGDSSYTEDCNSIEMC
ncbi:protein-tyrosine kinase 6 [Triplophysa dalaica]|uniref:protein-tyrosine kinase 6 n=1 Tax=Triplophysa dalaica TaxID=1582913 RepID=UPI0024DF86A9|nr:protein-tyrosine kinase 6 [Triplophysa dalaica]